MIFGHHRPPFRSWQTTRMPSLFIRAYLIRSLTSRLLPCPLSGSQKLVRARARGEHFVLSVVRFHTLLNPYPRETFPRLLELIVYLHQLIYICFARHHNTLTGPFWPHSRQTNITMKKFFFLVLRYFAIQIRSHTDK